jgi:hypothetical protein
MSTAGAASAYKAPALRTHGTASKRNFLLLGTFMLDPFMDE